jgi:hypothetical protein
MQRHLYLVVGRRESAPRPAKVVQLDARREARAERARRERSRPRPAA